MKLYNPDKISDAIVTGLVGKLYQNKEFQPATLKILQTTWLKPNTRQPAKIPFHQMIQLHSGKYAVDFLGEEEEHFLISYHDKDYFVYIGHAKIIAL